ncbi:MAG: hypothetical protein LBH90_10115 [Tannerella sp.]|jgi:hypothetical protein|nr:hypothetical protein [Tannerella sp.]
MAEKLPVRTISLHKRKKIGIYMGLILSLACAICFFCIFIELDRMPGKIITSILFLSSVGHFAFYLMAVIVLGRERFIGFFLSGEGFNDVSTGQNYGIVRWKDVIKIRIADDLEHPGLKYIVVKVNDPQQYIDREMLMIKKRSLILKYHYYGSPVCFSNRGLDCTFEELESCVRKYYEDFKAR